MSYFSPSRPRELRDCHDCGVHPGEKHDWGCDVARCLATGEQAISCDGERHMYKGREYGTHEGECGEDVWTGIWPGVVECQEFGWYSYFKPGKGWIRCEVDHPEASEDLNRLHQEAVWDPEAKRFVLRS